MSRTTQPSTTRKGDAARLVKALGAAVAALDAAEDKLESAETAALTWSDSVRQDAEARHGATPDTPYLWEDDPEYDASLAVGSALGELREELAVFAERAAALQDRGIQ